MNIYDEYYARSKYVTRKDYGYLTLFNYNELCQFDRAWDEYTLQARGLIVLGDNIIARPFPKFFNYGEPDCPYPPDLPFSITEKIDGSLGIWYWWGDQWNVATRGSFENEYTEYAKQFSPLLERFSTAYTVLTEIAMPRADDKLSRLITHEQGLYLLGAVNRVTGEDIDPQKIAPLWKGFLPKSFNRTLLEIINDTTTTKDTEGWVLRYANGFRVKVKTKWYLELFRIMSHLNEKRIKEMMIERGKDWLVDIPEEIRPEIQKTVDTIFDKSIVRALQVKTKYEYLKMQNLSSRRDFALSIKDDPDKALLFMLYDGKPIESRIIQEA